jgi:superfamily II DNA helicase RecQ
MDDLTRLFEYHPSHHVIVCQNCAIAIPPPQIVTHLQQRHPATSVVERQGIAAAAHELPSLAWKPAELSLRTAVRTPLPGLVGSTNGLVCQVEECGYTCLAPRRIRAHCQKEHGWASAQSRGGDVRKKDKQPSNRLWKDCQPCQRLFKAAGWPAYITVESVASEGSVGEVQGKVKAQRQRMQAKRDAAAALDTIGDNRRTAPNPWLELTGWLPHLRGQARAALLQARLVPDRHSDAAHLQEPDSDLEDACKAMRRAIQHAFASCRPEVVGRPALELIERRETGAESSEKPFYAQQKVFTIRSYSDKVVSILCYLWRTWDRNERPYAINDRQAMVMAHLKDPPDDESRRETLHLLCINLWITLLEQTLPDDEYTSPLLSGMAVLGLRADHLGGGWASAHEFSPTLSALITTSKALVVHYAYLTRERMILRDPTTAPPVYELVKEASAKFMTLANYDSPVCPMNRMLRLRTLARTLAKQRNTLGVVSWDGAKILVDRQSFTLIDLQSMVHGLYETVRMQLWRDVLLLDVDEWGRVRRGASPLPKLRLEDLVDQPADLSPGFSFLKHPDNHFDAWEDWLLDRVVQEAPLVKRFFGKPDQAEWRDVAVAAYMKSVRKFKESLFTLVHLTAGAPARGTEITSIQYENEEQGVGYRGVFVESGLVSFTTTYHKGYSFSKRVKTIHRYVPREVSELVVYFLGLAQPFIDDLQGMHNDVPRPTRYIWEPAPEETWASSQSSSEESNGSADEGGVLAGEKETPANPDGYWGTDRIRRVLRQHTSAYMKAALGTRSWRHTYPAIHRELANDGKTREWLEMLYWNTGPQAAEDARALQSGHTLQTEETNYGRSVLESPFQTVAERNQFRRVSVDWHRILGFTSSCGAGTTAAHRVHAMRRLEALSRADLHTAFRQLVNDPEADFRSKQQEGLQAIVQRRLRVLVIMATGAGKSLLFMLPASLTPGGVTVVIAPLTSLQDNLKDRCDKLIIPCAKWDGRRPPYWASIVLVTPESAVSPAFGRFIDEKRMAQQLDRIVIDECHVLLESTETWRPDILRLTEMTEKNTQVVYLTATLPPTLQPAFLQVAGLREETLTICREERTTRPNIAYSVVDYARGTLDTTLLAMIAEKRKVFGEEAQIIIYCPTVRETKRLSKCLGCASFYREMGSEDEKTVRVRAFASGAVKLCTATSMLGLGLDAPGLRVVIHTAMSLQLRQYVQESGRAGRTGLRSESIVLRDYRMSKEGERTRALSAKLDSPAKAFLVSQVCRRIAIDEHMDGRGDRQQCEPGEDKCDKCSPSPHGVKRRKDSVALQGKVHTTNLSDFVTTISKQERHLDILRRREEEAAAYELERLEQYLQRWVSACGLCMATRATPANHAGEACPEMTPPLRQRIDEKRMLLRRVRWEPYTSCLYCKAPQAVCLSWAEADVPGTFVRRKGGLCCQFDGVLEHAVAALLAYRQSTCMPWLRRQMERVGLTEGSDDDRLRNLLGKKSRMSQQQASQMARFLCAWEEGHV